MLKRYLSVAIYFSERCVMTSPQLPFLGGVAKRFRTIPKEYNSLSGYIPFPKLLFIARRVNRKDHLIRWRDPRMGDRRRATIKPNRHLPSFV